MKRYCSLLLTLLVSGATVAAFAQQDTSASASTPLVYNVENTGAHYPAPVFPGFDWLPIVRPLPDPFRFFDGSRDTSFATWERRRNEIKKSVEKYEIGLKPDGADCTVAATYTPPPAGSNTGQLQVVVTRTTNGKTVTLNSRVYLPQGMGSGPFPALIPMSLAFPPFFVPPVPNYGSLPASVFSSRPIATIDFFHNDVTAYSFFGATDHSADPFYQMYPELKAAGRADSDSGQYAAWAWGVSRLIDGIEIATHQVVNPLPIDTKHLAVTGCSYAGKMALFAGAFDERIALTIPQESGGGGAPSWRVSQEIEGDRVVEALTHTDRTWFASQLFQFSRNNVYKLPHDHHELMAMVAPRALFETGNTDFNWLSNRSNYITARATQRIYNTLGIGDRFGFYIDGGHAHCGTLPAEDAPLAAFVDKFLLGQASVVTDVEVHPYPANLDYQRWTWWWGKEKPKFPNDWNPGDGTVVMSMNRPMDIYAGGTVKAGYALSLPDAHPASTVSLAGGSVQVDVYAPDGRSYTLTIPIPDQSYSVAANDHSWFPSPNQKSPLVYQGSATAGFGGSAREAYFSVVGENDGNAGNPAGPGFTAPGPLNVRFHSDGGGNGAGGSWSQTETVTDESP
jgi:hypothetical protein